jgi:hypothetical protein
VQAQPQPFAKQSKKMLDDISAKTVATALLHPAEVRSPCI